MAITTSAAREIQPLIRALAGSSAVEREAAVARLAVIGVRGVPHLLDLLADEPAGTAAHVAALAVLESIDDRRALDAALARLGDARPAVARAAVAVVRRWLDAEDGATALDRLAATAMDEGRDAAVRLAALVALADLPEDTRAPIWRALAADADPRVRGYTSGSPAASDPDADAGGDPATLALDTPPAVRRWLDLQGATAPLALLHRLVETARRQEQAARARARRLAWTTARARVHEVLTDRGSRVALYDVRETMETAREPLAPAFLQAAERLREAGFLEPLARLHRDVAGEPWWRDRLATTARAIIAREKLSSRHAAMKRVKAKYPAAFEAFTRASR